MRVKEAVEIVKHIAVSKYLDTEKDEAIRTLLGTMGAYRYLSRTDLFGVCDYLMRENKRLKKTIKEMQEDA